MSVPALIRRARSPILTLLGAAACVAAAAPAWPQAQPTPGPEQQPDPVPADSTRYPTLFDRIGLHPQLASRFDVNRSATTFSQGANVRKHFGPAFVLSDWNVRVQGNKTQNDRRQVSGTGKTRLSYSAGGLGGWNVGSEFGVSRNGVKTTFTRNVINATNIDLIAGTGFLGHMVGDGLGLDAETLEWTLSGTLGAVQETSVNERRARDAGNSLQSADSTRADGSTWSLGSDLAYTPSSAWNFNLGGELSRGRKSFETEIRPLPDSTESLSGTDRDRARSLDVSGSWRPSKTQEVRLTAGWALSVSQDFSTTAKAQETTDGHERNFRLAVLSEPIRGVRTEVQGGAVRRYTSFSQSTNDGGVDALDLEARTSFQLGRPFGWLEGIEVIVDGKVGERANTYENIPDYDEDTVYLEGSLKRAWGTGTSATLSTSGDLSQKFYAAPVDGQSRQDQDKLKQRVDFAFNYQLHPDVQTLLSLNWSKISTISIAADLASANVDETNLSAGGRYAWKLRKGTEISQDLIITAASSTKPFNEDESNLVRTSRLLSTLKSGLWRSAEVVFEHYFQFQDQGAYRISQFDGVRKFLKDTERINQRLESEVNYRFTPGMKVYYRQKFETRDAREIATDRLTRNPKTEIRWGGELRHAIDADFSFDVRFDRISSTAEPSYWIAAASASRLF